MEFSNPIKFLESPLKKNEGTHISAVCIVMCNMPPQNARHFVDQCTAESEREPLSCPNLKYGRDTLPNYKGKGVVIVVIYANSGEDKE